MTEIILYTLPTCSICHVIKTKLEEKNIPYVERDFNLISNSTDRAPVLEVIYEPGKHIFYYSPSMMLTWINEYQGDN